MRNLNISLPAPLKQFVDEQVGGHYSNASAYVRELTLADGKKFAEQQFETFRL